MTITRSAPSGKRLYPSPPLGNPGWDGLSSLVFTVIPAPHTPGIYSITIATFPIVNATTGTITLIATFSAPGFGPSSITFMNGANINTPFIAPRHLLSDGTAPIIFTYSGAAVTGPLRLSINNPAEFILATLPEGFS